MKRISGILLILCAVLIYSPRYVSAQNSGGDAFRQEGIASWYGAEFDGRPTASGEIFNSSLLTAAHPDLPFGTLLNVTNKHNNKSVTVKVNDRGPFVSGRIIDISKAAAEELDMITTGTAPVIIRRIDTVITPGSTANGADPLWTAPPEAPPPAPPAAAAPPPAPAAPPPPQRLEMSPAEPRPPAQQPPQYAPPPPPPQQPQYAPPPPQQQPQYAQPPVQPQYAPPPAQPAPPPAVQSPRYSRAELIPMNSTRLPPLPEKKYRLQVGAFRVPRFAVLAFETLKNAGLNPAYERYENLYRVVLPGINGSDLDRVTEVLGSVGFKEALIREER